MAEIRKVAVIGAGVMGAGIAAHVANAGLPVVLLDIVAEGPQRSALAAGAIQRLLKADPAPFMHPRNARLVTPGNLEDDLGLLADCDWIIEAVVERLDVKQALYARIDAARKPGAIVSSNTSTIPLALLTRGLSPDFVRDFLITHFFNPPRYMRLLEVVAGTETRPEAVALVSRFADLALGKSVVRCHDRPGFIANRLGTFWLSCAVAEAVACGMQVEEVDALIGTPFGLPKTGVFGLLDLVGIDLVPLVGASMAQALPKTDPLQAIPRDLPLIRRMIAEGHTGRKAGGGFYRVGRAGGARVKEAIDLASGAYRPQIAVALDSLDEARRDPRALMSHPDRGGRYAWRVMGRTLAYAAALVPEVADDIAAVDEAMRLGYAWSQGPFELIDRLGADWLAERLSADGIEVPPLLRQAAGRRFYRVEDGMLQALGVDGGYRPVRRPEGVLLLADVKRRAKPVARNGSAALWDIGDGVACFEFTSKMNALDPDTLALLATAIGIVAERFKALVIYNEAENFSVGANLGLALFAANIGVWPEIERMVAQGQQTYKALKYAPFPVVAAPAGMALGGGCEILLHADAIQAHAESYVGLVEAGVGVVPAWGGCKELLARWQAAKEMPRGPMPAVAKAFETLSVATVAKSAAEARDHLFLRPSDGITMNRDRLLADAKARALVLAENYVPPQPPLLVLPGESGHLALGLAVADFRRQGKATEHDVVVAGVLAEVLSGGDADPTQPVDEERMLALERAGFMTLIRHPASLARIEAMLETGKPLRN